MQDLAQAQTVCYGSTDGTGVAGGTVTRGCVLTRTAAGHYTIAFNAEPPGPDVPAVHECSIFVEPIGVDPAVVNLQVTKTLDGAGPGCNGFTLVSTGSVDVAFDWLVKRIPDGF